MSELSRPRFLAVCCEEPFRIFFPLGLLVGISGVSLWPLYFTGLHKFYPGVMHARLMVEGFMGAFIIGFLGTAVPRLTGTAHFRRAELAMLLALYAAVVGTQTAHRSFVGDVIFLALLLTYCARMAGQFSKRTDLPPPSFVLVAFGFANAITGTVLLLVGAVDAERIRCTVLGSMLLYQGFALYLVLGIGGLMLPRILKLPRMAEFPQSRTPSPGWWKRATFAIGIGAVLFATFVTETLTGWVHAASVIRFLGVMLFVASEIAAHRSAAAQPTTTLCVRVALLFILLGLLFPAFWPAQRVAGLHLLFMGGFTLITFTVATQVVLGHSGMNDPAPVRVPFLAVAASLLLAGTALRIIGDFMPATRGSLLSYASYLWMTAALAWGWWALPKLRIHEAKGR